MKVVLMQNLFGFLQNQISKDFIRDSVRDFVRESVRDFDGDFDRESVRDFDGDFVRESVRESVKGSSSPKKPVLSPNKYNLKSYLIDMQDVICASVSPIFS